MAEDAEQKMKTCKKCLALFLGSRCKQCAKTYMDAYRISNKQKLKVAEAKYKKENKEKIKASNAAYYEKNASAIKKASAEYRKSNPDYRSTYYLANREKIRAADNAWRILHYKKNAEKIRAKATEYRKKNIDLIRARSREINAKKWRENPEGERAKARKNYEKYKEKILANNARWAAENKEAIRTYSRNRRARERGAKGKISVGLSEKLYKLQRGKCACCGMPLGKNFHLDHIMPLALGGTNEDSNMQLLTQRCNNQKHAKHPVDFMQQRGFLI